jgi:hypothetical protein
MNSTTPTQPPSSAYHLYLRRASRGQLAAMVSSASAVLAAEAAEVVDIRPAHAQAKPEHLHHRLAPTG